MSMSEMAEANTDAWGTVLRSETRRKEEEKKKRRKKDHKKLVKDIAKSVNKELWYVDKKDKKKKKLDKQIKKAVKKELKKKGISK